MWQLGILGLEGPEKSRELQGSVETRGPGVSPSKGGP